MHTQLATAVDVYKEHACFTKLLKALHYEAERAAYPWCQNVHAAACVAVTVEPFNIAKAGRIELRSQI